MKSSYKILITKPKRWGDT